MHVLHVADTLDHHPGRFSVSLPGLLAALRDAGLTNALASGVSHDEWVERGLAADEIAIVDEEDGHAAMSELAPLAKSADVVHIHTFRAEVAKFAVAAARAGHRPYVVSPWGELGRFCDRDRALSRWLEVRRFRKKFHDALALTCSSSSELSGVSAQALHHRPLVLKPGFDFVPPDAKAVEGPAEHMGMPWADGRPLAAMLGDIDGSAGIAELIQAVGRVPGARDWHIVLAGRPVDSWLPRYQQDIERRRLAEQLALVVYPDVEQQAAIIDAAEFVVLASTAPTAPFGGLQGLAAGKPILVSGSSGFASLAEGGAGVVAQSGVEGLTAGLRTMLAFSRDERRRMGTTAAANAHAEWSWKAVLPAWLELYRSCR